MAQTSNTESELYTNLNTTELIQIRLRMFNSVKQSFSKALSRCYICFFFFSSRRRHTRLQGDWSSDVCSSDLLRIVRGGDELLRHCLGVVIVAAGLQRFVVFVDGLGTIALSIVGIAAFDARSEERRVGKECRSRWSPYH